MQKESSNNDTLKVYAFTAVFILIWNALLSFIPVLKISPTPQPECLFVGTLQWFVSDSTTAVEQEKHILRQ